MLERYDCAFDHAHGNEHSIVKLWEEICLAQSTMIQDHCVIKTPYSVFECGYSMTYLTSSRFSSRTGSQLHRCFSFRESLCLF